jgi:hypothetical protein
MREGGTIVRAASRRCFVTRDNRCAFARVGSTVCASVVLIELIGCGGGGLEPAAERPAPVPPAQADAPALPTEIGPPSSAAPEQTGAPAPTTPAEVVPPSAPPTGGISREEDAMIPPGPPGEVLVARNGDLSVVSWKGTRDDRIRRYQVHRRCDPGDSDPVGFVPLHPDDERNRGEYRFEDRHRPRCEYTVAAVGASGRPGPRTVDILPPGP